MAVLLIRVGALRKGARTGERSTWGHGAATTMRATTDALRRRVSVSGMWLAIVVATLLPLVLSVGNDVLMSQICIYAVIALSLTMLTGWAGQVSLGQFGLVAVGALVAVHLGTSLPLPLVMLYGGAVTAVVAILVGLPALRVPGLFLAVTTLGVRHLHAERRLGHARASRCPASTRRCARDCPTPPTRSWPARRSSASAWPRSAPSPGSRWACWCCPS